MNATLNDYSMNDIVNESEKMGTVPMILQRLRESSEKERDRNSETLSAYNSIKGGSSLSIRPAMVQDRVNIEMVMTNNQHVILRMIDHEEKVVRMIGWYLLRGTNATALFELDKLDAGDYRIDIMDVDGCIINSGKIRKN